MFDNLTVKRPIYPSFRNRGRDDLATLKRVRSTAGMKACSAYTPLSAAARRRASAARRVGAASVRAGDFPKPDLETANYRCATAFWSPAGRGGRGAAAAAESMSLTCSDARRGRTAASRLR